MRSLPTLPRTFRFCSQYFRFNLVECCLNCIAPFCSTVARSSSSFSRFSRSSTRSTLLFIMPTTSFSWLWVSLIRFEWDLGDGEENARCELVAFGPFFSWIELNANQRDHHLVDHQTHLHLGRSSCLNFNKVVWSVSNAIGNCLRIHKNPEMESEMRSVFGTCNRQLNCETIGNWQKLREKFSQWKEFRMTSSIVKRKNKFAIESLKLSKHHQSTNIRAHKHQGTTKAHKKDKQANRL